MRTLPNPHPGIPLKILQITDCHQFADADTTLHGCNTRSSFESVMILAQEQHWPPDCILATGDLSHDGSEASYRYLLDHFERLGIPTFCLPGNHDEGTMLDAILHGDVVASHSAVDLGEWRILMLDSSIVGSEGGHLGKAALDMVTRSLSSSQGRHVLICLHHNLVPTCTDWLDTMTVDNADALFAITRGHSNVKAILWGHIHQKFEATKDGVALLGSPSTCFQFLPNSAEFQLDTRPPGYRWLLLHTDGHIDTGIERIAAETQSLAQAE
ncbi:MAG TPA: 3',5'-cyclic-AMP phosphodiesterase [Chromatiaceae bacterium]|nr:3',5'-cyclic-AMP phosphodiesterase [Chromatiaceae bacterium]HIN82894.1 3',5'-cyclic-AMP phosphodiesterase [Chromatiales bacterium]HIA08444.1 3',5'-cyclic-AMP phosphodiesterase [Chromatiaceae bacterium]HIB85029.1 3',5'-cyclic-AMP phosphodiesterase [Chromatiaceae bacterium]HIO13969.1 3',5'-cyclic-AMP phosphodiesterase [Chromatiales bacterium]